MLARAIKAEPEGDLGKGIGSTIRRIGGAIARSQGYEPEAWKAMQVREAAARSAPQGNWKGPRRGMAWPKGTFPKGKQEAGGDLEKGIISAAMKFGATRLKPMLAGAAGRAKAMGSSAMGRAGTAVRQGPIGRAAQRAADTPTGQKVMAHPHTQAVGEELHGLRTGGFREGVGATTGRFVGAAIGGQRGARIGRNVGWAAEYAPWVGGAALGGAHLLGLGRKKRRQPPDEPQVAKISPVAAIRSIRGAGASVLSHPRVAAAIQEIKEQGAPKTPLYRLGRIIGSTVAPGSERATRIGGYIGHATELGPIAYAGGKVLVNRRKRQAETKKQIARLKAVPGASLVLGKNLASSALGATTRGIGNVLGGTARVAGKAIRNARLTAARRLVARPYRLSIVSSGIALSVPARVLP